MSSHYSESQSILELSHFMSQSFTILECIYTEIIQHFDDKLHENTLETHELISHLYQLLLDILSDEYSVKSSTIMSLFLLQFHHILIYWMNGCLMEN